MITRPPRRKTQFNLTVESPTDGMQHARFKRLLKLAGRACGLRAIDYRELSADGPPPDAADGRQTPAAGNRGAGVRGVIF